MFSSSHQNGGHGVGLTEFVSAHPWRWGFADVAQTFGLKGVLLLDLFGFAAPTDPSTVEPKTCGYRRQCFFTARWTRTHSIRFHASVTVLFEAVVCVCVCVTCMLSSV